MSVLQRIVIVLECVVMLIEDAARFDTPFWLVATAMLGPIAV